jgi:DNA mismatch endonuclease (patch repair protein)
MADTFDRRTRSWIMSRVSSSGTRPELAVAGAFRAAHLKFQTHVSRLPGNPDFVFRHDRLAVFVNGCFWHRHGCSRCRMPSTNVNYWSRKIGRNAERDREIRTRLHREGWRYVTIWECTLKAGISRCLRTLEAIQNLKKQG